MSETARWIHMEVTRINASSECVRCFEICVIGYDYYLPVTSGGWVVGDRASKPLTAV